MKRGDKYLFQFDRRLAAVEVEVRFVGPSSVRIETADKSGVIRSAWVPLDVMIGLGLGSTIPCGGLAGPPRPRDELADFEASRAVELLLSARVAPFERTDVLKLSSPGFAQPVTFMKAPAVGPTWIEWREFPPEFRIAPPWLSAVANWLSATRRNPSPAERRRAKRRARRSRQIAKRGRQ